MLIDLSVPLNKDTPVYPGDPKFTIKPNGIFEKDGYRDSIVTFGNHNGTHIDAPSHMIEEGKTLDKFPIDKFSGVGILIDVQKGITLNSVQKENIEQDSIVLFYTGMSKKYHNDEYFTKYPAISEEIANYLVNRKIKMVGVDMCSVDHDPFPVHRIFLRNEILIIENLTNLSSLAGKKFAIFAFPLKFEIDGSPARVVTQTM